MKRFVLSLLITASVLILPHPLDLFMREQPNYEILLATETRFGSLYVLDVEGMEWRGMTWRHRVGIVVPKSVDVEDVALVILGGGSRVSSGNLLGKILKDVNDVAWVAPMVRVPVAVVGDIPNQPIWGLKEDALIAETFKMFLEDPDPTLPLLVPMTFGAMRALDAIQDFLGRKGLNVENFMVGGASKRGWTTYLTAVFDPRVFAIFPMVYDNLNIKRQMEHQLQVYGTFSEKLSDYVKRGLMERMESGTAEKLLEIVDPYNFRLRLSLPKILVLAASDEYWTVDSANVYLDDLPGETWIFYMPNVGHHFDRNRLVLIQLARTLSAFLHLYPKGKFPNPEFSYEDERVCIQKENGVESLELWYATSDDMDFRDERWSVIRGEISGDRMCADIPKTSENLAYFPRVLYEIDGFTFYLSGRMKLECKR